MEALPDDLFGAVLQQGVQSDASEEEGRPPIELPGYKKSSNESDGCVTRLFGHPF